jgi:hypothetical protein
MVVKHGVGRCPTPKHRTLNYCAGVDVSLEASSVCVVNGEGKIIRKGKLASEPEDLIQWLRD